MSWKSILTEQQHLFDAPTSELADLLWRDWHAELELDPSPHASFSSFNEFVKKEYLVKGCLNVTFLAVLQRDFDPEESIRVFIDTLLRFTGHRPYVRRFLLNCGVRWVRSVEQAKIILDFAKSVPAEEMYKGDRPFHLIVALSGSDVFLKAGAPGTRLRPSDPSLLITTSNRSARLLLQEGESPDDPDGRCRALEQLCRESSNALTSDFD